MVMEVLFASVDQTIVLQLIISLLLGALVGVERSIAGKMAGMRTFALVSIGATLFTLVGKEVTDMYAAGVADPLRVVGSVVSGIGFIGAGLIIFSEKKVKGLTTAAGLWVSAALGVAVGFELYFMAVFASFLTLFVLTAMWNLEEKVEEVSGNGK